MNKNKCIKYEVLTSERQDDGDNLSPTEREEEKREGGGRERGRRGRRREEGGRRDGAPVEYKWRMTSVFFFLNHFSLLE